MARQINSLHHGGAKAQRHREHRSKKGRTMVHNKGRNPLYVAQSEERIRRDEERYAMKIWRSRAKKATRKRINKV